MTLRFCLLQAHYRNPVDFSNKGLQDAEKAFEKLSAVYLLLKDMEWTTKDIIGFTIDTVIEKALSSFEKECVDAMNDDFNTAIVLSNMFKVSSYVNQFNTSGKTEGVSKEVFEKFKNTFCTFFTEILGLIPDGNDTNTSNEEFGKLVDSLIEVRNDAKKKKDFTLADAIRNTLSKFVTLQDSADKTIWKHEKKK